MKKIAILCLWLMSFCGMGFCQQSKPEQKTNILLMIAEQNIEGPATRWWLSEIDLSTTESKLASTLIAQGYGIIEPSVANKTLKREKAFRLVNPQDEQVVRLGKVAKADYVILGKAVASSGSTVAGSNMRSCFANISAKIIKVKDGQVIAYLDATGSSIHTDVITGGKEALSNAATDLAGKVIASLQKEGGK